MQSLTADSRSIEAARQAIKAAQYPPIESINRPNVPTEQAAYYLDRKCQTLRGWACREDGPLRPLRVHGRLAWPVSELRRVLGVA